METGRIAAKREEEAVWLLRIFTVVFFIILPLWGKADAAGCPASLDARQALSNVEYDRLCMGGTGSVARATVRPNAVSGRPVQTRMVLDVPPGDPRVNQRWYALGDRTEARRFREAESARQFDARYALQAGRQTHQQILANRRQGHYEWRDRDRSAQRWAQLTHRIQRDRVRQSERYLRTFSGIAQSWARLLSR